MGIGQTELSRSSHFFKQNGFKWLNAMKQNLPCIQILLFLVLQGTLNLSFEPAKDEIPWGPLQKMSIQMIFVRDPCGPSFLWPIILP